MPGVWQLGLPTSLDDRARLALARRGFALESATPGWNVAGIIVLAFAAITARSVALAGIFTDAAARCDTMAGHGRPSSPWPENDGDLQSSPAEIPA